MKILTASTLSVLISLSSAAMASTPLSFDFMVTGSDTLRPVLIFHDGENTYIQPPEAIPPAAITIKDATADRYGPYLMIRGIPRAFSLSLKKELVTITYTGKPKQAPLAAPADDAQPARAAMAPAGSASLALAAREPAPQAGKPTRRSSSQCTPRVTRTEAAYLIGLDGPQVTKPVADKVRLAIGAVRDIETVFIRANGQQLDAKAAARGKALSDYISSLGVPREKVVVEDKPASSLGLEMRVVRATLAPCNTKGIRIQATHRDAITVVGRADAHDILEHLAADLGIPFRVEGERAAVDVSVSEVEKPLVLVLDRIGKAINQQADIVLRPHELVIRYRNSKS